jgi:uncharacterized protein YcfL
MSPRRLFLLPVFLVAGCRADHGPASVPPPPDPMVALPGDAAVEAGLETLDVRTSETGGGSELGFTLRNKTDSAIEFCWSVEWYDHAGSRVAGSARAWHPAKLGAGAALPCRTPMPTPDAASWRLRAVRPDSNALTQGVSR